ncbi:MAG: PAS domain-containing protein [Rickettsiales bacterium]
MQPQRLTERLTLYWNQVRKEAPMPEFSHFNAGAVDDIWQQCVLFVVQPSAPGQPPVVNFYKVGDKLRSLYGADMTGRTMTSGQRHFEGAAVIKRIAEVIAQPQPLEDHGQFVNAQSRMVKYRSCLLPFGRDNKVTHIVVGLSWREF